jgi:hypothetical protein
MAAVGVAVPAGFVVPGLQRPGAQESSQHPGYQKLYLV